jgi:hypothetical protein
MMVFELVPFVSRGGRARKVVSGRAPRPLAVQFLAIILSIWAGRS